MNYQHPELQKRLAAEYVLGSLQGKARLRFERLMVEQPSLRRLVAAWDTEVIAVVQLVDVSDGMHAHPVRRRDRAVDRA